MPTGTWGLIGYRVVRRDEDGSTWHTSVTAHKPLAEVVVRSGKRTEVKIDPAVGLGVKLVGGHVQAQVQGMKGNGLSIYKDGKRIPLGFRLLAKGDEVVAEGKIEYG